MNKYFRKILVSMLVLITVFSICPLTASARSSFDYVKVVKHQSYNQDGYFVMSFTISNIGIDYDLYVWAKVFNSAGKEVAYWNMEEYGAGYSDKSNFLMDYSDLPSGQYTFKLYCSFSPTTLDGWYWNYTINHEQDLDMSFYFQYYEKVIIDGNVRHRFHIQCTNMEGESHIFRLYDSYGYLVMQYESDPCKTNSQATWVTWTGYNSMGGERYKCSSGEYTLIVTTSGSDLLLEETVYLNIVEEVKG